MEEVYKNIYVGNQNDYDSANTSEWAVVHACKDPFHKELVGYRGNLSPNHSNYALIEKGNRLALNLVDMDTFSDSYFEHHKKMLIYTIDFINRKIKEGKKILIHCNQGQSRSPSIAMLYLASIGVFNYNSFEKTEELFKANYPEYNPRINIRENIRRSWSEIVRN